MNSSTKATNIWVLWNNDDKAEEYKCQIRMHIATKPSSKPKRKNKEKKLSI